MRLIALIQCRDGSTRLPRKCTALIGDKILLQHIYDRAQMAGSLDGVVVSTSSDSPEIVSYCKLNDIPHYVGSEEDLLSRHLGAALTYKADAILRITGDELFIDPALLDAMAAAFVESKADALINWHLEARTISEGLDCAIVTTKAMQKLNQDKHCPREDWISYLDKRVSKYRVMGWAYPERMGHELHLSIDTLEDLERARRMIGVLGNETAYEMTLSAWEATK